MLLLLLAVALTSPFVSASAAVVPESSELVVSVTLDRGANVVVAHVIYADNVSDLVALAPAEGEWRGAFAPRPGAVPQVRFEALLAGNESVLSETHSIVALGVPMEALVESQPTDGAVEAEPASPIRLGIALLVGLAVLAAGLALARLRRST
ncbi:MAG: hypothetical protein HKN07_00640 [Acidimicrobiia bacterium]|nr:hypothetical protein [Acidimicrobiia bacterium]